MAYFILVNINSEEYWEFNGELEEVKNKILEMDLLSTYNPEEFQLNRVDVSYDLIPDFKLKVINTE